MHSSSPFNQIKPFSNHAPQSRNRNSIFDKTPQQEPFPPFQFSHARYHKEDQTFAVGDLVWYEIQGSAGSFDVHSRGIQWGEATVHEILPNNHYRLAGKAWSYDHLTHPLIGEPGGPPHYASVQDIESGRQIYRQWTITKHENSHVRKMALSNVDKVLHPSLASVPGYAMFKVWDRETIPKCPIPTLERAMEKSSEEYSLSDAQKVYGEDLQFQGRKQQNDQVGPEYWGITLEQMLAVKELPGYEEGMKMYDVVDKLIQPLTKGMDMGYALFLNRDNPLRAKQMVSHAWGEDYAHFVRALEHSNCTGPFWVCAMAIDQEHSEAIALQLGPSVEHGPFATVLKQATDMIAVFTPAADIYLRMWCVLEMFIAIKYGVPVRFAALNQQFRSGLENIYDAIYEHGQKRCVSVEARCGNETDEKQIRELIHSTEGKFDMVDSVVEWCKAKYYISEVRHPGSVFQSRPAHLLLMGGVGKLDYLAKTLSSVALAMDRISGEFEITHPVN